MRHVELAKTLRKACAWRTIGRLAARGGLRCCNYGGLRDCHGRGKEGLCPIQMDHIGIPLRECLGKPFLVARLRPPHPRLEECE